MWKMKADLQVLLQLNVENNCQTVIDIKPNNSVVGVECYRVFEMFFLKR